MGSVLERELDIEGFQIDTGIIIACNGVGLKNLLQSGGQWLEAHADIVNNLNVYPVPDGDTGTNMVLTMRAAMEHVDQATNHTVDTIAHAAAQGALLGARGNSGVILSQFLRGLADGLKSKTTFSTVDVAGAMQQATAQAYQSVIEPVEGTILTVARAMAEAAQQSARKNSDLLVVWSDILQAAKIAQASTPSLLPVLKEAGVTDSGGQGLVYIIEGGWRYLKNESLDTSGADIEMSTLTQVAVDLPQDDYGYDVQFLIRGRQLDVDEIRAHINSIGWSTLVVGDEQVVKVHVHTKDPGPPLSYGARYGIISDVVVENLDAQAQAFSHKSTSATAVIAVAPGQGLAQIFESLGCNRVIAGGQTFNPSVQEFVAAVNQTPANDVLILPNNGNVILAAQQARALIVDKNVAVLPAVTIPQGIAALLSFNQTAVFNTNVQRMTEAMQHVQTIEITRVVRDSRVDGIKLKTGEMMGLLNDKVVSTGQNVDEVSLNVLAQTDIDEYEIVTIYFGVDSSLQQAQVLAEKIETKYSDLNVEVHTGGQPHYQYIISME